MTKQINDLKIAVLYGGIGSERPVSLVSGDNIYYLEQTWHTHADRVELLDEKNLDLAFELSMQYAPAN